MKLGAVENLVSKRIGKPLAIRPATLSRVAYDLMEDDPSTPVDEAHRFEPH
jgi:hypothetical protein